MMPLSLILCSKILNINVEPTYTHCTCILYFHSVCDQVLKPLQCHESRRWGEGFRSTACRVWRHSSVNLAATRCSLGQRGKSSVSIHHTIQAEVIENQTARWRADGNASGVDNRCSRRCHDASDNGQGAGACGGEVDVGWSQGRRHNWDSGDIGYSRGDDYGSRAGADTDGIWLFLFTEFWLYWQCHGVDTFSSTHWPVSFQEKLELFLLLLQVMDLLLQFGLFLLQAFWLLEHTTVTYLLGWLNIAS